MSFHFNTSYVASVVALGLMALPAHAQYAQTNLVSDSGTGGTQKDPNLVNPWGLSRSSNGVWWVSDNGANKSTLYGATGNAIPLVVTVPGGPTGTIFNGTGDFILGSKPAVFVFDAEDGSVSAWNGGTIATVVASKLNGVYKGLALADHEGSSYLYAANFRSGKIDVLDTNFHYVNLSHEHEEEAFTLHDCAPFNIQNLGGTLFVTFAKQDAQKHDEVDGAGLGFVAVFTTGGKLIRRFEHGDWLNAPWGLALAPGDFGSHSHQLLVGNFGSGQIATYNLETGRFEGLLTDASGKGIWIDGLWGLSFGNGGAAGAFNALYFSAGPNGEANGLMGTLTALNATEGNSN